MICKDSLGALIRFQSLCSFAEENKEEKKERERKSIKTTRKKIERKVGGLKLKFEL